MTSRTPALRILIGLMAAFAVPLVAPTPAYADTVSLSADRSSAPPSIAVNFTGGAATSPVGTTVLLQRRLGSGSWTTIKSATVNASHQFSVSVYVATGAYKYRSWVNSTSVSPELNVSGTYGRNVPVPAAGEPFTLSARMPKAQSRLVKAQFSTDGGTTWTTRGQATSNSTGWVGIRTYLVSTSYVRTIAPATSTLPVWVGPRGVVTIGTDPVIKKILDDTNAHRATHGLPPLKLHPSLNKVAGNWAYRMHQTCDPDNWRSSFFHNTKEEGSPTNYWELYPPGWTGAAENIAAGSTYETVVSKWIGSAPHHKNIDGNYTDIGIGYYFGTNCYQRYYVQNFAKY